MNKKEIVAKLKELDVEFDARLGVEKLQAMMNELKEKEADMARLSAKKLWVMMDELKEEANIVAPAQEEKTGIPRVDVYDSNDSFVQSYNSEEHGESFKKLASDYAAKIGGKAVDDGQTLSNQ